jgi:hypothetical protein
VLIDKPLELLADLPDGQAIAADTARNNTYAREICKACETAIPAVRVFHSSAQLAFSS